MAGYRPRPGEALEVMNSRQVQAQLLARAQRGLAAFRAAAPVRTGDFRRNVQVEPMTGSDGRKGYRIRAFPTGGRRPNAPLSIAFGTARTRAHRALDVAAGAVRGRRGGR